MGDLGVGVLAHWHLSNFKSGDKWCVSPTEARLYIHILVPNPYSGI